MKATMSRRAQAESRPVFNTQFSGGQVSFPEPLHYLDGPRCTLFEFMLSLSRKMRIIIASSWILKGVFELHWSNRRPALTANSSSRPSLSGCSIRSIRCIFPATCAHTSKTVADMPGVSWITRASWGRFLRTVGFNFNFPDHAKFHLPFPFCIVLVRQY